MKLTFSRLRPSLVVVTILVSIHGSDSFCPQQFKVGDSRSSWIPSAYTASVPRNPSSFEAFSKVPRRNTAVAVSNDSVAKASATSSSKEGKEEERKSKRQRWLRRQPTKMGVKRTDEISTEEEEESEASSITAEPVRKFRLLKDIMWIREAVEDLTAAEFACSVEKAEKDEEESPGRQKKRAVDYEKLLAQLDRRVEDVICGPFNGTNEEKPTVLPDRGMGRFVYTQEQREVLLKATLRTRDDLIEAIQGQNNALDEDDEDFVIQLPEMPELRVDIPKEEDAPTGSGPKLYVRDDGTVDWEGALQDRAALRKFGGAVWARINGQTPDELGDGEENAKDESVTKEKQVTAKIEDTPAILEARDKLNRLQQELKDMQSTHTALLSSGISEGQAVANVRLANLDTKLRNKIRLSDEKLKKMEQQVSYHSLVYELERIYTYLASELGNPAAKGYVPLQDRLNVAEYGLVEGQVESCSRELEEKGEIDADILAVIAEQMTDFKRRLGIDYYVTGLTYDKEAIQTYLSDLLQQTKSGLMFYVKGCRLFWNDILYCSSLFGRALQGYTLKPREVRTIRRTFKDIITFIPVVIILIIPLSPVGHVLVFGAIQRFFPDFFPSCFTEQRQNLLQLYETTEFSEFTINETPQQQFARFLEAAAFFVVSKSRNFYKSLFSPQTETQAKEEGKE